MWGKPCRLWLTELSDALPADAQLLGFDVSADQYPPGEWLPGNVALHEHDAFTPFAPELLGSFDVVHLRFFITLLNGENIRPLLDNLKTLLSMFTLVSLLYLVLRNLGNIDATARTRWFPSMA